jgi:hypothetical protein
VCHTFVYAKIHRVRDFVNNNYTQIKRLNPQLPFLVRPHMQLEEARIVARYGMQSSVSKTNVVQTMEGRSNAQLRV